MEISHSDGTQPGGLRAHRSSFEAPFAGTPKLISNDLRLQLEAATHGIGVALLPEPIVAASIKSGLLLHVLPEWKAAEHIIHVLYPSPRGMLPSVRSLIDYLMIHLPASIQERSVAYSA